MSEMHENSKKELKIDCVNTVLDLFSFYGDIQRIRFDVNYLFSDMQRDSKLEHLSSASYDMVAHSAHVGGFLGGLGMFLIYKVWQRVVRKYGSRQDVMGVIPQNYGQNGSHNWGTGQRLASNPQSNDNNFYRRWFSAQNENN